MTQISPLPRGQAPGALAVPARLAELAGKIKSDHLIYVASIAGMVVLWHIIATSFFKPQFFPGPLLVLATGEEMVASGELFEHISISLERILTGFLIGSAIAAPLGLLMGSVRLVRAIFDPYAQFFRFVPSLAWLTPVVLWFGIGETSKILIIIYTTMFIVLINTMVGVAHIPPNKLRAAACLGATPLKSFVHVTLPATLPFILRHAACHGQFVCDRGRSRDDCSRFRPRLPDLQLTTVDGHRQDLHRDRLPRHARARHRPILPLSRAAFRAPIWANRVALKSAGRCG